VTQASLTTKSQRHQQIRLIASLFGAFEFWWFSCSRHDKLKALATLASFPLQRSAMFIATAAQATSRSAGAPYVASKGSQKADTIGRAKGTL